MAGNKFDEAIEVLTNFMREMYEWDIKYYDKLVDNFEKYKEEAKKELTRIYGKYLINKTRKQGREVSGRASSPPEYDPELEKVERYEEIASNKIIIYTKQGSGFMFNCRYTLKSRNNIWFIDKKETYDSYEKKWCIENF